jgi:hypothetical protein
LGSAVSNLDLAHPRGIKAEDTISHKRSEDSADQRSLRIPITASHDIINSEGNSPKHAETISELGDEKEAEKNDGGIDDRNNLFAELLENWDE